MVPRGLKKLLHEVKLMCKEPQNRGRNGFCFERCFSSHFTHCSTLFLCREAIPGKLQFFSLEGVGVLEGGGDDFANVCYGNQLQLGLAQAGVFTADKGLEFGAVVVHESDGAHNKIWNPGSLMRSSIYFLDSK